MPRSNVQNMITHLCVVLVVFQQLCRHLIHGCYASTASNHSCNRNFIKMLPVMPSTGAIHLKGRKDDQCTIVGEQHNELQTPRNKRGGIPRDRLALQEYLKRPFGPLKSSLSPIANSSMCFVMRPCS